MNFRIKPAKQISSIRHPRHWHSYPRSTLAVMLGIGVLLGSESASAVEDRGAAIAMNMPATAAAAESATAKSAVRRTTWNYAVPALKLVREDGAKVSLDQELNDGRPVVLNFIFTSCTTICPLSSQVFSLLQQRLGKDRDAVHLVSISIDPEEDTPARLLDYARQFNAGKEWNHYTGSAAASVQAQMAFGAYRGNKMSHAPVTLLRATPGGPWVRLDGFATADDIYSELQDLRADQEPRALQDLSAKR